MNTDSIAIIGGADGPTAVLGEPTIFDILAPAMGVGVIGLICIGVIFYVKKRYEK